MPTRLKFSGLAPGTHSYRYEETDLVCPEHGEQTFDLAAGTCLAGTRDGEPVCGKKGEHKGGTRINRQPDVFPGDIVEIEDYNHPTSKAAENLRWHVDNGNAVIIKEKADKPAKD
jgi:hypothetical protein